METWGGGVKKKVFLEQENILFCDFIFYYYFERFLFWRYYFYLAGIRAVKMAEKSILIVDLNMIELYSNLKGIISVRGKKAFGFSPEATRGRIKQNITNLRFFKA